MIFKRVTATNTCPEESHQKQSYGPKNTALQQLEEENKEYFSVCFSLLFSRFLRCFSFTFVLLSCRFCVAFLSVVRCFAVGCCFTVAFVLLPANARLLRMIMIRMEPELSTTNNIFIGFSHTFACAMCDDYH